LLPQGPDSLPCEKTTSVCCALMIGEMGKG
jgi:hypothetical protein